MERVTAMEARKMMSLNENAEKILENCYKEITKCARTGINFVLVSMRATETTANQVIAQLERDGYEVSRKVPWCARQGETHVLWIKW